MNQTIKSLRNASLIMCVLCALSNHAAGGTIAQLRALGDDQPVSAVGGIEGVITSTTDFVNATGLKIFHLQDSTGAFEVFGTDVIIDSMLAGFSAGDRVSISGVRTGTFNGELNLVDDLTEAGDPALSVVALGEGIPEPLTLTPIDIADGSATAETLEASLIRIEGVTFLDSGQFSGLTNYTLTDGVDAFVARVSTEFLDLVGTDIPQGPVAVTGILGQFDTSNPAPGVPGTDYQLLLRSTSDIVAIPEPTSVALLVIAVLGLGVRRRQCGSLY